MKPIPTLFFAGLALTGPALAFDGDASDEGAQHPVELKEARKPTFTTGGDVLIRGATIHTATRPAFVGDVLVIDGDIAEIGENLALPDGVLALDAEGQHLAPGVVDCHSHMGIEGGVNEGTLSITAECDITDVINADDDAFFRALAGGVTAIHCLHGSANAIGGRSEVIKLKQGRTADELRIADAPQGIKFALGENPKQSNWGRSATRFPSSRPGVEALFYRAFSRAQEYQAEWKDYEAAVARGEDPPAPRRDQRLETLAGILDGSVVVHSHSYRADEVLMLLRVAEHFGFQVGTLQHVLEGYKIAHEIAAHGAGPSTFSDWWAYKIEAYDAIPHNAALLDRAGAVSSINSDSGELVRHLYHEAAKSVRYAQMDPVRALALVTLNPAIQLGIDHLTGSIEVGKDADLVLLNHDPMSTYARVEWTLVDGEVEFERIDSFGFDAEPLQPHAMEPAGLPFSIEAVAVSPDELAEEFTVITGGTVHPVSAPSIEGGTVVLHGNKILAVGADVQVPEGARVIDATGQHVWPGMIALDTPVGIHEIGAVRATQDQSEIGGSHPDLRVSSSINPDSAHIGVTRSDGITRSQTAPQSGGPIKGQSALFDLDGMTWEELLSVDRDMLHINFPRTSNRAKEKKEPEAVEPLRELFEEAREYARLLEESKAEGVAPPAYDRRLEELAPYARAEKRVALHAGNAQTILYALKFAEEEELDAVLFEATEGWKVADAIAESGVRVVVGPVLSVPRSEYDPYDSRYANPAVLHRAGVRVAIAAKSEDNTRNLPFHAGFAVAYGLPWEEGIRSVTLYPAEVLGVDDRLGSLEPGKLADVVVTDGDLLETTTQIRHVFIDGRSVDLDNRQTELYDRYSERLERLMTR